MKKLRMTVIGAVMLVAALTAVGLETNLWIHWKIPRGQPEGTYYKLWMSPMWRYMHWEYGTNFYTGWVTNQDMTSQFVSNECWRGWVLHMPLPGEGTNAPQYDYVTNCPKAGWVTNIVWRPDEWFPAWTGYDGNIPLTDCMNWEGQLFRFETCHPYSWVTNLQPVVDWRVSPRAP